MEIELNGKTYREQAQNGETGCNGCDLTTIKCNKVKCMPFEREDGAYVIYKLIPTKDN